MEEHDDSEAAIRETFDLEDTEAIRELGAMARRESYRNGQEIFESDSPAESLLLILAGEVDLCLPIPVLRGERGVRIDRVAMGAVVGWSAITEPFRYVLSAWAVGSVEALVFGSDPIREWLEAHPRSGLRFQRRVANVIGRRLASTIAALRGEIEHSVLQKRRGAYD